MWSTNRYCVVFGCLPLCVKAHSGLEALEAGPSTHEHQCARAHGPGAARSLHAAAHGDPHVLFYVGNVGPPVPMSPVSLRCRPGQEMRGRGRIQRRER